MSADMTSTHADRVRDQQTQHLGPVGGGGPYMTMIPLAEWEALKQQNAELLEALKLDMVFYSRTFTRESIEEFRSAGYAGDSTTEGMRAFLQEKKRTALSKAEGRAS